VEDKYVLGYIDMAGLLFFWFFNGGVSELSLVTNQVGMDIAILQKEYMRNSLNVQMHLLLLDGYGKHLVC
jgi:hypothetical protein